MPALTMRGSITGDMIVRCHKRASRPTGVCAAIERITRLADKRRLEGISWKALRDTLA